MKKINNFTHQYQISKTIRSGLIPIGDTQKNFEINRILEEDEKRQQKRPQRGQLCTHCAVGQADDVDKSLFELVV